MQSPFEQQSFFLTNIPPLDLNVSDTNAMSKSKNMAPQNGHSSPSINTIITGSTSQLLSPPPVDFLSSTPPSITRVLTYSSPFIHLFSYLLSLMTWSTGNPSESCLLVAAWWTVCQYPTEIIIYGTHLFILTWIGLKWVEKVKSERLGKPSSASKSTSQLDLNKTVLEIHKISDKLSSFHAFINSIRSHIDWTDSTKTQKVVRGLIYSYPVWIIFAYSVSLTWVFIIIGTFGLVWHSPWFKFIRYVLMQSDLFRGIISLLFGYVWGGNILKQGERGFSVGALIRKAKEQQSKLVGKKVEENRTSTDLIFRFVLYENQRWWLGLDWTTNLFLNERPAWSDEYNEPTSPNNSFQLPPPSTEILEEPNSGFRRYTRRRKWVRAARLVETIEKIDKNNDDQVTNGINDDDNDKVIGTSKDFEIPNESSSNSKSLPYIQRKPNGKFDVDAISKTNGNSNNYI
ncbi:16976_t:CDS:2 [Funneliformis geosporum]|uniref:17376_t:CDS:1 n=1 Tax=Funneliformis geosporum TaxID=1117311 RepID=A0A9W4WIE1_9GLOM|nr:17376_t:CDS:2 [Funneliformis geosporum]CAI2172583.1 16976_t:CDS:2 [Funneliformis geosporum]